MCAFSNFFVRFFDRSSIRLFSQNKSVSWFYFFFFTCRLCSFFSTLKHNVALNKTVQWQRWLCCCFCHFFSFCVSVFYTLIVFVAHFIGCIYYTASRIMVAMRWISKIGTMKLDMFWKHVISLVRFVHLAWMYFSQFCHCRWIDRCLSLRKSFVFGFRVSVVFFLVRSFASSYVLQFHRRCHG